jgi:putative spermidine/putrescine transport system permease protein
MKRFLPTFAPYQSVTERLWFFTLRSLNALTLVFLVLPILVIVPLSFSDSSFLAYPMPGVSLRWYQNLFESDEWMRAAQNSFIVAPAATLLATVLGTLAAVGLNKAEFRGKGLVMAVLISPMVVPVVVVGVGVYIFFAQIGLSESYTGLILAHAALGAPFVVTTVSATLQGFNHNLVRASLSLGAGPLRTFFRITLPVIAPGLITLFVAGPNQSTLPRQMFSGIRENISPTIAALATILIVFSTCLLLALEWLRGRNKAAAKF